jgi:hypothetical protein
MSFYLVYFFNGYEGDSMGNEYFIFSVPNIFNRNVGIAWKEVSIEYRYLRIFLSFDCTKGEWGRSSEYIHHSTNQPFC